MLRGSERMVFVTLFWALIVVIAVIKVIMMVISVRSILQSPILSPVVYSGLHVGYYLTIAVVECLSAAFLLKNFRAGLRSSMSSPLRGSRLYRYLMRSTEIRLSTLAFIGIMRSAAYPFNPSLKRSALSSDLDTFASTLECLFPIVML